MTTEYQPVLHDLVAFRVSDVTQKEIVGRVTSVGGQYTEITVQPYSKAYSLESWATMRKLS